MLTLRGLKKRSKAAVPILIKHYGLAAADVFLAERGENHHGVVIRCTHGSGDPARSARPNCECSWHPLKGTPMTGGMSCGEEPEWDERTTLETLQDYLIWSERPTSMTDREWRRTLGVARVKPFDPVEFAALMREDHASPVSE